MLAPLCHADTELHLAIRRRPQDVHFRTICRILILLTAAILVAAASGCDGPSSSQSSVPDLHAPTPYVSIVDVNGRGQETVILHTDLSSAELEKLADLCNLVSAVFPSGWINYGPDASFRRITLSCGEQTYVLSSWHPPFEENPNLVAASYGVTTLDGLTREQFLNQDDRTYVERREAFDQIESELRTFVTGSVYED